MDPIHTSVVLIMHAYHKFLEADERRKAVNPRVLCTLNLECPESNKLFLDEWKMIADDAKSDIFNGTEISEVCCDTNDIYILLLDRKWAPRWFTSGKIKTKTRYGTQSGDR